MASDILRNPKFTAFDSVGAPLVGGKVYTYDAGTTTPQTTYHDNLLSDPNTNPVILDARGEADIWFEGPTKVVLKDADDVTIWTFDNIGRFSIEEGANLYLGPGSCIEFEGTTDDDYEIFLCGGDPTLDRVQNLADASGTILCTPLPLDVDGNEKTITKTPAAIRTITASDNLVTADCNKIIACNHATVAIVVNLDATNIPSGNTGFTATVMQQGAAAVSFTSSGTIISKNSKVIINGQGVGVLVVHLGSDVWWIAGDLA